MQRLRGWGLMLAVMVPLLLLFSWNQLGVQSTQRNLERYEAWSANQIGLLFKPLQAHFIQHHKAAAAGELTLPPVPAGIGVKAWGLSADSTLGVELDAKWEGHLIKLRYVPVIRNASVMLWDCVSEAPVALVGKFCRPEILKNFAGIAAQLDANDRVLAELPAIQSASGVALAADVPIGSVVVVPANPADLDSCGFQCVKPQSCVTPRALACVGEINEGNKLRLDFKPSTSDYRGKAFADHKAADAACAQSLGATYRVALASGLASTGQFAGGHEYWVHNDIQKTQNCWGAE